MVEQDISVIEPISLKSFKNFPIKIFLNEKFIVNIETDEELQIVMAVLKLHKILKKRDK